MIHLFLGITFLYAAMLNAETQTKLPTMKSVEKALDAAIESPTLDKIDKAADALGKSASREAAIEHARLKLGLPRICGYLGRVR